MKKKLLSLLLVLCMVLPMVPVGVLTATAAAATPAVTLQHADGSTWKTMNGKQGETLTLPLYTGTSEGKTFAGWDMTGDGKADYVDGGAVVLPKTALTLKAVWKTPDPDDKFVAGKTSFKDNLPTVSGSTVTYNNNWQMGYVYNGAFSAYSYYDNPFIQSGDVWGTKGGLYHSYNTGRIAMAKDGYLSTIAFTMPFSGTVELGYDQLLPWRQANNDEKNNNVTPAGSTALDVAIYVNGVKVWPNDAAWYHYDDEKVLEAGVSGPEPLKEANCVDALADMKKQNVADANGVVTKLYVEKGDVITFRAQRGNATTWMLHEQPFVNAVSAEGTKLPSSVWSENMPIYDMSTAKSGDSVIFQGNWSWVAHEAAKWSNVVILDTHRSTAQWDGRPMADLINSGDNFILAKDSTGLWGGDAVITMNDRGPTQWGNKHSIGATSTTTAGIRYIAEYDGRIAIDINSLLNCKTAPRYAVLVNGEMVWPTKGGSYTDIKDWFHSDNQTTGTYKDLATDIAASATYSNLSDIVVSKGDSVELLIKTSDGLWDSLGSIMDMTVRYTKVYGDDELLVTVENPTTGAIAYNVVKKGDFVTLPSYTTTPEDFIGWKDVWSDSYYEMSAKVTPTTNLRLLPAYAVYETYTELEANGKNWPAGQDNTAIADGNKGSWTLKNDFGDGWAFISYDNGKITKQAYDSSYNSYGAWTTGILWLNDTGFARCNINGSMADYKTYGAGFSYEIPYNGVIRLDTSFNVPDLSQIGSVYFSILKIDAAGNSTVVYGDQTNAATEGVGDKYTTAGAKTANVKHVNVTAGDQLVYLFRASKLQTGWYSDDFCRNFHATIAYETKLDTANTIFVSYTHPATGRDAKIQLTKGDTFTFPSFDEGYVFFGWDVNGDGKVDYNPGAQMQLNANLRITPVMASSSSLYESMPTYDATTKLVTYKNGWQIGVYDRHGKNFMPFTGYDAKYHILCNYGTPWNTWGGMYMTGERQIALKNMTADGMFWSQTQYTAAYDGVIEIDYNKLIGMRNANMGEPDGNISYKLAIYKSGVKIWPAGDEWFSYNGTTIYESPKTQGSSSWREDFLSAVKATGAFPMTVEVNAGDTIEFRIEQGDACSRMFQMDVSAKYVAINSAPKLTQSSVVVKDTFTLNLFAHLNGNRLDYKTAGLRVWLSETDADANDGTVPGFWNLAPLATTDKTAAGDSVADVTYQFSIKNIAAQNLSTKFYVRTYVTYGEGESAETVYGDVVEVSVEQYAQNAVKNSTESSALNRLATAMLQYTAAVNNYFGTGATVDIPANLPAMPQITPKDVYNMTTLAGGKATFAGATLSLRDTIDMVILIDSKLPADKLTVLMDDNAVFKTPKKLKVEATGDGLYRVTVSIRTADYQKPFYFKVMDHRGDVQSGVLTYSVESYVARKYAQEPENENLINLLQSMLLVCKTANDAR